MVDRKMKHKLMLLVLEIMMPIVVFIIILSCIAKINWRKRIHINSNLKQFDGCMNISYI
jgi:hypothetical protein